VLVESVQYILQLKKKKANKISDHINSIHTNMKNSKAIIDFLLMPSTVISVGLKRLVKLYFKETAISHLSCHQGLCFYTSSFTTITPFKNILF